LGEASEESLEIACRSGGESSLPVRDGAWWSLTGCWGCLGEASEESLEIVCRPGGESTPVCEEHCELTSEE
jgi:hypothetical protein